MRSAFGLRVIAESGDIINYRDLCSETTLPLGVHPKSAKRVVNGYGQDVGYAFHVREGNFQVRAAYQLNDERKLWTITFFEGYVLSFKSSRDLISYLRQHDCDLGDMAMECA